VVRWAAQDLQVSSRWLHPSVEADQATIDTTILPAIAACAGREGRLPASLEALVAAGDLGAAPVSKAGRWMYARRPGGFTIGVGDPPHDDPCASRTIELHAPANPDPDRWRVRDWYHDS
jgi:hypothetical protein